MLTAQLLAIAYDFHDTRIINIDFMLDTALAAEFQPCVPPADGSKMTFT